MRFHVSSGSGTANTSRAPHGFKWGSMSLVDQELLTLLEHLLDLSGVPCL